MHILGVCIWTLLGCSLARVSGVIGVLALLRLMRVLGLLSLLKGKKLLLLLDILRLSVMHLLLEVHLQVDRSHSRVRLHGGDLRGIHPLSTIGHRHRKAPMLRLLLLLLLLLEHHALSKELLLLMLLHQVRVVRN